MTWLKNIIKNFPQGSPLHQEEGGDSSAETTDDSGDGGGGGGPAPTEEKTEAQKYKIPAGPPP
tara:strand:- start:1234 stop:1422 length:189 start_codon:yes stop_codon:yes gene_type:complete